MRDDKRQNHERQRSARHDDGEETVASPWNDIRQGDGRDPRRAPCDGGDQPACPHILLETAKSRRMLRAAVQSLDCIAHRRRTHARRLTVMRSAKAFGSVEGSSTLTSFSSSEVMRI